MEVFRELYITLNKNDGNANDQYDGFVSKLEEIANQSDSSWRRNAEMEKELRIKRLGEKPAYGFQRLGKEDFPDVTLWLAEFKPGTLYVSNIVPETFIRLSVKQYNRLVENYVHEIIEPAKSQFEKYKLTEDQKTAHDYLGHDPSLTEMLQGFSRNRSAGASHPDDRKRWEAFVIACHKKRDAIELSGDAIRLLLEDDGWDEYHASELASEFDHMMQLLSTYDNASLSAVNG